MASPIIGAMGRSLITAEIIKILTYTLFLLYSCNAQAETQNIQGPAGRNLKQDFAQFSALQNTEDTFGGWGGRWVIAPAPALAPMAPSSPSSRSAATSGSTRAVMPTQTSSNGGFRPTVVRSMGNRRPASSSSSSSSSSAGVTTASDKNYLGGRTTSDSRAGTVPPGPVAVTSVGAAQPDIVGINPTAVPAEIDSLYLSRTAGTINGRRPPQITNPAVAADLPRFISTNGTFVGGSDVGSWPSINPGSRIDAVFLDPAATSRVPPLDNITVLDPAPVQTVRVPAASFESGYCVPRQAYLVVNVTALGCVRGSNLTRWDGEPVCARVDCSGRSAGTNVMHASSGCRTVVQRPKPICPSGCQVIEQLKWNTTVNRTQLFTKCSCKAGNQPCPSFWTACTCYEGLSMRNLTQGFVVCSETQGECDRKCNLAVSGTPRLAPLCPVSMDPFLSINATGPPTYPLFGWNMAAQARRSATLGLSSRSLKQLVHLGRRLAMLPAREQRTAVMHAGSTATNWMLGFVRGHAASNEAVASSHRMDHTLNWLIGCSHQVSGYLEVLVRRVCSKWAP